MRSPLSGPIATLLMFVPLVVIPLLAVFGLPQFSTSSPATQVEDLKFAPDKDKTGSQGAPQESDLVGAVQITDASTPPSPAARTASAHRGESDPFAEFVRPAEGEPSPTDSASGNRTFPPERRPQRWPADNEISAPQKPLVASSEADAQTAAADPAELSSAAHQRSRSATRPTAAFDANRRPGDADRGNADSGKGPSNEARGWKAAVARLNALGIRDYQWQPGEREGEFHFSCRFAPRANPRVIRRFEAEAGDPLEAVQLALGQIDEWKAQQSKAEVRASSNELSSNAAPSAPSDGAVPLSAIDVSNR